MKKNNTKKLDRRKLMSSFLLGGLSLPLISAAQDTSLKRNIIKNEGNENPLLWAAAWSATAAEYGALCYQAFNLATLRVENALNQNKQSDKSLAIITDVDEVEEAVMSVLIESKATGVGKNKNFYSLLGKKFL